MSLGSAQSSSVTNDDGKGHDSKDDGPSTSKSVPAAKTPPKSSSKDKSDVKKIGSKVDMNATQLPDSDIEMDESQKKQK